VSNLRRFLCAEDPPIQAILDAGVIDDLIKILSFDDENLISEAIWYV
jgi:hypothetical protein